MRITEDQLKVLESFTCERLSSHDENLREISFFQNARNENLVYSLQGDAYEDDQENRIAYYLVKDTNGQILFFFSLKCGLLYDYSIDNKRFSLIKDLMDYFDNLEKNPDTSAEDLGLIKRIRENVRSRKGISKKDIEAIKKKDSQAVLNMENAFSPNLQRVGETFAGIEIVHFCSNDRTHDIWEQYGIGQKLGVVVFWHFIVEKVLEVVKLIGCQYLFLFAADSTPDEFLINYYRALLHFKDNEDRGTAIPLYDDNCRFMYQEIATLEKRRDIFYEQFNLDEEDV